MADRAIHDQNLVPSLIAVSNGDGKTPVTVWADPATHGLISSATLGGSAIPASGLTSAAAVQIVDGSGNQITSFGGGTQYTDGGTPPTHPIAPTLELNVAGTWLTQTGTNVNGSTPSANVFIMNATAGSPLGRVTLTDNNNSNQANITAASTAAAATDEGLVVSLSPNSGAKQGTAAALTAGWPTINGELADVTGTFTNATQTTSVTATGLDGYGNTLISINGTYGTATAVFEGSDDGGTTWYGVQAARDNTNVIELGYTSLTNISQTWQINNPGFDSLRVRSTAVASGTVNVRLSSSAAPVASGTIVGLGTSIPSGTNVIGHVIADSGSTTAVTQATGTNLHAVVDSGTIGTTSAVVNVGQKTVGTSATQINVTSTIPTNGIIIQALSTNAASIFVGGSGVTTSTGFELVAGQAMSFTANLNTLYIISVASTTDKICYNVE